MIQRKKFLFCAQSGRFPSHFRPPDCIRTTRSCDMPVFSFCLVRSVHLKLYSIHAALQERNHEKAGSVRRALGRASQGHSCKTPQKKSKTHIDISVRTAYDVAISRRSAPERGSFHDIAAACLSCRRSRMRQHHRRGRTAFYLAAEPECCYPQSGEGNGRDRLCALEQGRCRHARGRGTALVRPDAARAGRHHAGALRRRPAARSPVLRVVPALFVRGQRLCRCGAAVRRRPVQLHPARDADRRNHRRRFLRPERARSALPVREQRERALQAAAQKRAGVRGALHRRAARFHQQRPPARRQGAHHAR